MHFQVGDKISMFNGSLYKRSLMKTVCTVTKLREDNQLQIDNIDVWYESEMFGFSKKKIKCFSDLHKVRNSKGAEIQLYLGENAHLNIESRDIRTWVFDAIPEHLESIVLFFTDLGFNIEFEQ